ncbi:hypothetical protein PV325_000932 [Microctonus aethiopoides]|nr:hypothetical protein PV325_000932 [Microctonus aethiopoides]
MVVEHDGQCEHFGRVVKPIREVNVAWVHRSFSVKCRFCRYPMDLSFGGPHIPRLSEVSHKRMVSNNYSSSVVYADMPPDPPGTGERSE